MAYKPSQAELEILQILWDIQPAGVRSIHERILETGKEVGYTTVLKQVQRLTDKGVLEKSVENGVHLYRSLVGESDVKQHLADKLLQTAFGGSAVQMLMHALGGHKTDPEEVKALKNWLDQQFPEP